jgi:hypothetical protein
VRVAQGEGIKVYHEENGTEGYESEEEGEERRIIVCVQL